MYQYQYWFSSTCIVHPSSLWTLNFECTTVCVSRRPLVPMLNLRVEIFEVEQIFLWLSEFLRHVYWLWCTASTTLASPLIWVPRLVYCTYVAASHNITSGHLLQLHQHLSQTFIISAASSTYHILASKINVSWSHA